MPSIVQELQRAAMDPAVPVADLLRKALLTAKKLGLNEFETWVSAEMDGYPPGAEIPEYRHVSGWVKALNPVRGWIPVQFADPSQEALLSRMPMSQPVAELEAITAGADRKGSVMISYGGDIGQRLLQHDPLMAGVALQVPVTRVTAILDSVRNALLRWALQLEADGIAGEDLSFSTEERKAAERQSYSLNNFYGPVGTAQIQQNSPGASQESGDVALNLLHLGGALDLLKRVQADSEATDEGKELAAEIATIEVQMKSPRPKWSLIREALRSARRIAESAAGRVLGSGVSRELADFDWSTLF